MRSTSRNLMSMALLALLGLLLIGPGSAIAGEAITVKFGIGPPIDDPEGLGATRFADLVAKKTDGRASFSSTYTCLLYTSPSPRD